MIEHRGKVDSGRRSAPAHRAVRRRRSRRRRASSCSTRATGWVGAIVDTVHEVAVVPAASVSPPPPLFRGLAAEFIRGDRQGRRPAGRRARRRSRVGEHRPHRVRADGASRRRPWLVADANGRRAASAAAGARRAARRTGGGRAARRRSRREIGALFKAVEQEIAELTRAARGRPGARREVERRQGATSPSVAPEFAREKPACARRPHRRVDVHREGVEQDLRSAITRAPSGLAQGAASSRPTIRRPSRCWAGR